MLDTLKLRLVEFEVLEPNKLMVQPPAHHANGERRVPGQLLWNNAAGPVFGTRAYYNRGEPRPHQLTIKPGTKHDSNHPSTPLCYVTLSIPRFLTGSNFRPVNKDGAAFVLRKLQRKLLNAGIKTDIMQAVVTRLDCFANIVTDEPYEHYRPLFRGLHAPRTERREYSSGDTWLNSEYELSIYDKRAEMQHRREPIDDLPPHVIRIEHRLLKARKVSTTLQVTTVRDLLEHYDRVQKHFHEVVRQSMFSSPERQLRHVAGSQTEQELRTFKKNYPRQWMGYYVMARGAEAIDKDSCWSTFRRTLKDQADKGAEWRFERKMGRLGALLESATRSSGPGKRLGDLQDELKRKFFNKRNQTGQLL